MTDREFEKETWTASWRNEWKVRVLRAMMMYEGDAEELDEVPTLEGFKVYLDYIGLGNMDMTREPLHREMEFASDLATEVDSRWTSEA